MKANEKNSPIGAISFKLTSIFPFRSKLRTIKPSGTWNGEHLLDALQNPMFMLPVSLKQLHFKTK